MNKWIFSILVLMMFSSVQAMSFSDESEFPSWGKEAIETVREEGIMSGFGDGTFRPKQNLTRAEAVTLLLRAKKEIKKNYNGVSRFPDVSSGVWFEEAVGIAASNGWVQGWPDGLFYPGDNLTRAEFAVLVSRTFGLEAQHPEAIEFEDFSTDLWYAEAVTALHENKLLRNARNRYFRPEQIVTRAEAAWTFALIATRPGINGSAGEASYEKNGYSDSRRVAIKPRDFDSNRQSFSVERRALHLDVDLAEKELIEVSKTTDWEKLGNVRIKNTLDYRADIEHLQFYLRFDRTGAGPSSAFEVKLVGPDFEVAQQVYRNGEVIFTGMDHHLASDGEVVFSVLIKQQIGTSYFPKEAVGTLYVKELGGEAFKPYDENTSKRIAEVLIAPVEYNGRNLRIFTFKP